MLELYSGNNRQECYFVDSLTLLTFCSKDCEALGFQHRLHRIPLTLYNPAVAKDKSSVQYEYQTIWVKSWDATTIALQKGLFDWDKIYERNFMLVQVRMQFRRDLNTSHLDRLRELEAMYPFGECKVEASEAEIETPWWVAGIIGFFGIASLWGIVSALVNLGRPESPNESWNFENSLKFAVFFAIPTAFGGFWVLTDRLRRKRANTELEKQIIRNRIEQELKWLKLNIPKGISFNSLPLPP